MHPFADRYFDACWGTEPIRLEIHPADGSPPYEHELTTPTILIGRSPHAHLSISDPNVAPQQMLLQLFRGRLYAVHLSQEVPTLCGRRLWEQGWVKPTYVFEFASVRLRVINPDQQPNGFDDSSDPLHSELEEDRQYTLELPPSRRKPRPPLACNRPVMMVGRFSPSQFLIRHASVAPVHAVFVETPQGVWVSDVSGHDEGMLVNDQKTPWALLHDNDTVTMGKVQLRIHPPVPQNVGVPRLPMPQQHGMYVEEAELPIGGYDETGLMPHKSHPPAWSNSTARRPKVPEPVAPPPPANGNENFKEVLTLMAQMFSQVLENQQQFVKDELDRMERITTNAAKHHGPPAQGAPAGPKPAFPPAQPPPAIESRHPFSPPPPVVPPPPANQQVPSDNKAAPPPRPFQPTPPAGAGDMALHAWLENQLGNLDEETQGVWQKLLNRFRPKANG